VNEIAKTQITTDIEQALWKETYKQGTFNCFETTIGFGGKERVDMLQYNTKGIWRCYEVKASKADFHSKAKKTFVGHYNYFVMPEELYEEVKGEIESYIGVWISYYKNNKMFLMLVKNPKKQKLKVDEQVLKDSMIRSLFREVHKAYSKPKTVPKTKIKRKVK